MLQIPARSGRLSNSRLIADDPAKSDVNVIPRKSSTLGICLRGLGAHTLGLRFLASQAPRNDKNDRLRGMTRTVGSTD